MIQHLLVVLIFVLCLWFVIRRIAHTVNRAKNNDPRCITCSEAHCPMLHTRKTSQCTCQDTGLPKSDQKRIYCKKKRKKTDINLAIQK